MLCTTWGVNYFIDVVWSIGWPLELNSVISLFHSKSGTSVHVHCNSCIFHPEPCSTLNVQFVSFNSVTVTSHTNKTWNLLILIVYTCPFVSCRFVSFQK